MPTIDRGLLLAEVKFWLPAENILDDAGILKMIELVILKVGDDDTKLAEVQCKALEAIALRNLSEYATGGLGAGIKREKTKSNEIEYFNSDKAEKWKSFIGELKNICPLFGYSPKTQLGIKIYPGKKIKFLDDCSSKDDPFNGL